MWIYSAYTAHSLFLLACLVVNMYGCIGWASVLWNYCSYSAFGATVFLLGSFGHETNYRRISLRSIVFIPKSGDKMMLDLI